jgi:hypothetical protein
MNYFYFHIPHNRFLRFIFWAAVIVWCYRVYLLWNRVYWIGMGNEKAPTCEGAYQTT